MRTLALAHYGKTEGVHHIAQVIFVLAYPAEHYLFLILGAEVFDGGKHIAQFVHDAWGVFLPTLLDVLFGIFLRRFKEEFRLIPQVLNECDTALNERHHLCQELVAVVGYIHAVCFEHRLELLGKLGIVEFDEIFVVEPFCLIVVEAGTALRAVSKREVADKFFHTHNFAVVAGIPAQKCHKVDQRLGQETRFAESVPHFFAVFTLVAPFEREHGEAKLLTVALAEFALSGGLEKQWQVHKLRHSVGPTECFVEKHVQRCTWQPLFTSYHMAHFHQVVVNYVCQVIGRQLVGALIEHFIVENRRIDGHLAADKVIYHHIAVGLYLEAHHIGCAGIDECLHLFGRHRERVAHHAASRGVVLEIGYLFALGVKFFGSIECYVGVARIEEHIHMFAIYFAAFALLVGTIIATFAHSFIYAYAEPCQCLVDIFFGSGHKAARVGVLDAQYHISAVLTGKQIVIQCCAHSAYMQGSCG